MAPDCSLKTQPREYHDYIVRAASGAAASPTVAASNKLFSNSISKNRNEGYSNLGDGKIPGTSAFRIENMSLFYKFWDHLDMVNLPNLIDACLEFVFKINDTDEIWRGFAYEVPGGGGAFGTPFSRASDAGTDFFQHINNGVPLFDNVYKLDSDGIFIDPTKHTISVLANFEEPWGTATIALLNATNGNRMMRFSLIGREVREAKAG